MDIEVGFKRIAVQVGSDQVIIETKTDMPGGRPGDPIWGIFYADEVREAEVTPEGDLDESFVTVTPGRFVVITLAAVEAIINQVDGVVIYEVYPEGRVWFTCLELDVKDAIEITTEILGESLEEIIKKQIAAKQQRAAQPQVAPS